MTGWSGQASVIGAPSHSYGSSSRLGAGGTNDRSALARRESRCSLVRSQARSRWLLHEQDRPLHATGQQLGRVEVPQALDDLGDEPGPAGLVAGAEAGAVVAVEVLVEHQQVLP